MLKKHSDRLIIQSMKESVSSKRPGNVENCLWGMHLKSLLGSITRVGYCIPAPDFYFVLHGLLKKALYWINILVPTFNSFIILKIKNRNTVIKPITYFLFQIRKQENGFISLFHLSFLTLKIRKRVNETITYFILMNVLYV